MATLAALHEVDAGVTLIPTKSPPTLITTGWLGGTGRGEAKDGSGGGVACLAVACGRHIILYSVERTSDYVKLQVCEAIGPRLALFVVTRALFRRQLTLKALRARSASLGQDLLLAMTPSSCSTRCVCVCACGDKSITDLTLHQVTASFAAAAPGATPQMIAKVCPCGSARSTPLSAPLTSRRARHRSMSSIPAVFRRNPQSSRLQRVTNCACADVGLSNQSLSFSLSSLFSCSRLIGEFHGARALDVFSLHSARRFLVCFATHGAVVSADGQRTPTILRWTAKPLSFAQHWPFLFSFHEVSHVQHLLMIRNA